MIKARALGVEELQRRAVNIWGDGVTVDSHFAQASASVDDNV